MTTRRWMIALAVVALAVAGEQMRRRATQYRRQAERHAKIERACRKKADVLPLLKPSDWEALRGQMVGGFKNSPRLAAYHSGLRRKYEHAAGNSWLTVDPDPPSPQP